MSAEARASSEIYDAAKADYEIQMRKMESEMESVREESTAMGFLQKLRMDETYNQMLKHMTFYKVKNSKGYRKGGLTWEEFCRACGESASSIDKTLKDLVPFLDNFSADFADFFGLGFNKVKYLGRSISAESANFEDGAIVVDGVKVELKPENKSDIEGLIEELKATQKRETQALRDQVSAQRKVSESKQKYADKLEEEMARYKAEREGAGFEPGEEEFIDRLKNAAKSFHGMFIPLDAARGNPVPEPGTRAMVVAYINTLSEIRNLAKANLETAEDYFGITANEAAGWQPPEPADEPDEDAPPLPANVTPLTRTETE